MKYVLMVLLLVDGGVEQARVPADLCSYAEMTLASGAAISVEGRGGSIEVEGVLCVDLDMATDAGPVG